MIRKDYIDRLANLMKEKNIDGMMIAPSIDFQFLMGFLPRKDERFKAIFVLSDKRIFYIISKLNYEEAYNHLKEKKYIFSWADHEGFLSALARAFDEFDLKGKTIAVNRSVRAVDVLDIQKNLDVRIENGKEILEQLRIVKNNEEIEHMKKAAKIADEVMNDIVKYIHPGLREGDIKKRVKELFVEKGAAKLAFEPIVASGPNGSKPQYDGDTRCIQEKDVIILDFGCRVNGYCSDISRTVFVGGISEEEKEIYDIVLKANAQAENFAKEGVTAESVDKKARDVIQNAGYGENFIIRTGHGIGFCGHEAPDIKGGNKQVLQKGMSFSIEPGIYIPDHFGVRIEDIVLITEDGPQILNKFPKEIIVI